MSEVPAEDIGAAPLTDETVEAAFASGEDGGRRSTVGGGRGVTIALVGVVLALAFFAAYAYAARSAPGGVRSDAGACADTSGACEQGGTGACDEACATGADTDSCGECGTDDAWTSAPTGQAVVDGGVQRIAVNVTDGYFDPTVIELAAGVPTQLVFSEGRGCLSSVRIPYLAIERDLTSGGATIELPPLAAGEYPFSCGMEMVYGVFVVR